MVEAGSARRIVILGATGSVGGSALDVIRGHRDRFQVTAVVAGSNAEALAVIAHEFSVERAVVADPGAHARLKDALAGTGIMTAAGEAAVVEAASGSRPDIVLTALLMLLYCLGRDAESQSREINRIFGEVEWITIFFFIGLFVVVRGVEVAGVLHWLAQHLMAVTGGDRAVTAMLILWASAILSAVVDNIPFVATMIPLVKSMAPTMGGDAGLEPLWC